MISKTLSDLRPVGVIGAGNFGSAVANLLAPQRRVLLYARDENVVRRIATEERERLRTETLQLESKILGEARAATAKFVQEGRAQIEREAEKIRVEMSAQREVIARQISSRVLGREVTG